MMMKKENRSRRIRVLNKYISPNDKASPITTPIAAPLTCACHAGPPDGCSGTKKKGYTRPLSAETSTAIALAVNFRFVLAENCMGEHSEWFENFLNSHEREFARNLSMSQAYLDMKLRASRSASRFESPLDTSRSRR